jgi:hypothetical protein
MHKLTVTDEKRDPALDKYRTGKVGAVKPATTREMYYCRIDNADCRFVMPFGFDYVCKHLNSHQFLTPEDAGHGKVIAMYLPDSTYKLIKREI